MEGGLDRAVSLGYLDFFLFWRCCRLLSGDRETRDRGREHCTRNSSSVAGRPVQVRDRWDSRLGEKGETRETGRAIEATRRALDTLTTGRAATLRLTHPSRNILWKGGWMGAESWDPFDSLSDNFFSLEPLSHSRLFSFFERRSSRRHSRERETVER